VVKHALKRFFNRIDASDSQEERNIRASKPASAKPTKRKEQALKAGMKDFLSAAANLDNSG
jgi:hypothetical protein